MPADSAVVEEVSPGLFLDARKALLHPEQGWLAVADLHLGFDAARRRAGGLFPKWGFAEIREGLLGLAKDHRPRTMILVGDITDQRMPSTYVQAGELIDELAELCSEIVLIKGNHDARDLAGRGLVDVHRSAEFVFHHGHEDRQRLEEFPDGEHITGHLHPACRLGDSAGLRLKMPALVRRADGNWILPAFSPWAGGAVLKSERGDIAWACSDGESPKILPLGGM